MALVVEDGSIVPDANSYISLEDAKAYATERDFGVAWTGSTDSQLEAALLYATRWLDESWSWKGGIVDATQALDWPRDGVIDDEGRDVPRDSIPVAIQQAEVEMAHAHRIGSLAAIRTTGIDSVKAGPVEVKFLGGGGQRTHYQFADRLVRGYALADGDSVQLVRA